MQTTTLKKEKRAASKNGGNKNGKKTISSNGKGKLTPLEIEARKLAEQLRIESGITEDYSNFTEEELEMESTRLFNEIHNALAGTKNPFV